MQRWRFAGAWIAAALVACGPSGGGGGGDGVDGGVTGDPCISGAMRCAGDTLLTCQDGTLQPAQDCPGVCVDGLGCAVCQPGTGTCNGEVSTACRADGTGYEDIHCDPLQGMSCSFETGVCTGECTPDNLGESYIGCEYFPTVTGNEVDSNFRFAVAVSNTSAQPADIHIEGGALAAPITFSVPANSAVVRDLDWEPTLKACMSFGQLECGAPQNWSAVVQNGAYHLRSNQPVTVYQFNPLEYSNGGQFSYTNDASLLLPANALTPHYYTAAWPVWNGPAGPFPGLIAITATEDNTRVSFAPTATTVAGTNIPSYPAGTSQDVFLDRGDVLQVFNTSGDLTGSVVNADRPVQVIAGHYCTQVPIGLVACDHVEESMFPFETLSKQYIVAAPAVPTLPQGKDQIIRVVATQAGTELTYDPPQPYPTSLPSAGSFIEIPRTAATFQISANHKILVAQYMTAQEAGGDIGDPAMALAVATDQYRTSYLFHAPITYDTNYVNVIAPDGAAIFLDGNPLAGFTPIGSTGYSLARATLGQGVSGNHTITGDLPFGITVYGYGQYTSYFYPGGLDLTAIPIE